MKTIAENVQMIQAQIQSALVRVGKTPQALTLLAVSKTFDQEHIREAYQAGLRHFGENYVQEALGKIEALKDLPLVWHFIGPLQNNKTKTVAEHFHWFHTLTQLKTAERLNLQRPDHLPPLQVCIQVNVDGSPTKSGVMPEAVVGLAKAIATLSRLQLRGLMSMPDAHLGNEALTRQAFAQTRELLEDLQKEGLAVDALSMGMSGDFRLAIEEGSTLIRLGQSIFGKR